MAVLAGTLRGERCSSWPGLARERGIQLTKSDQREGGRAGMLAIWKTKISAFRFHFMFALAF